MSANKLCPVLIPSEHEIKSRLVFKVYANFIPTPYCLQPTGSSDFCIVWPVLLLATVWPFMVDVHSNSSQTSSWQQQMYLLRLMDLVQSAVDSKLLCVLGTGWKAPNTRQVPVISLPDVGVETLRVDSQGLERLCWLMGVRWGLGGGNDPEKLQHVFLLRNLWPSFTFDRHSSAATMAERLEVHKRRRAAI